MGKTAAIILAAGGSSRFGKPKQLLAFHGGSLLRRTVDAAQNANCSPIVVVTGATDSKIQRELDSTEAVSVRNENWRSGIGTSIRAGVQYLIDNDAGIDAVVLLVCDQPFVDAGTIRNLIATHAKTGKPIVASSYGETRGVPAVFDRSCFDELLGLGDDRGAKSIILLNPQRVAELQFPEGKIDIDTPDDWERLTASQRLNVPRNTSTA